MKRIRQQKLRAQAQEQERCGNKHGMTPEQLRSANSKTPQKSSKEAMQARTGQKKGVKGGLKRKHIPNRMSNTARKNATIPWERNQAIFLTGGIGDVLTLESYIPKSLKDSLHTIYYATNKAGPIKEIFKALPNYPNLKNHIDVWTDFSSFWCFFRLEDCIQRLIAANRLDLYPGLKQAEDWSIAAKFPWVSRGILTYEGSSTCAFRIKKLDKFSLPPNYLTICPFSSDKREADRDFNKADWLHTIETLEASNMSGVVLNEGYDKIPVHPRLIDLTNQTSICEAIEITKQAQGYIGINSCLSVIAAKSYPIENIQVKSKSTHLAQNKFIYYAPTRGEFVDKTIKTSFVKKNIRAANEVTVTVPQGLGDIFWVYQKIAPHVDKINFQVAITDAKCDIQPRSLDWLKVFPKTNNVEPLLVHTQKYANFTNKFFNLSDDLGIRQHFTYSCNSQLEAGVRLEDIDSLSVEWNVPFKIEPFELPYPKYITVYVSGNAKVGVKNQITDHSAHSWSTGNWCEFIDLFYKKYNLDLPIIIIGAEFDKLAARDINNRLSLKVPKTIILQERPERVLHILKNTEFFLGYQSGLGIVADNLKTPQLMMYFASLDKMQYTWCQPDHAKKIFFADKFTNCPEAVIKNLQWKFK